MDQKTFNKYKKFCLSIGCSKVDNKCPGNPDCQIIKHVKFKQEEPKKYRVSK